MRIMALRTGASRLARHSDRGVLGHRRVLREPSDDSCCGLGVAGPAQVSLRCHVVCGLADKNLRPNKPLVRRRMLLVASQT